MDFSDLKCFLDSLIPYGIPGVDMLVMQNHKPIFRHMAGWRDREAKLTMTGNELYYLYSCSKVATVTAALQLYEKGQFLLSDPLFDYIPEFRYMQIKDSTGELREAKNPITIRNLFTMTSGLSYELSSPSIELEKERNENCATLNIIRAIAQEPLLFEPGTHWEYSLSHDVLAGLVEVISGKRFSQYMQENIFGPLGMDHTGYTRSNDSLFAAEYQFNDEIHNAERIPLENQYIFGSEYESGGAGIISCVDDYIRLTDVLACDGIAATGERILTKPTIELMRTNQLNSIQIGELAAFGEVGYGYGLGVRTAIDRAAGGFLSPIGEFGWGGAAGAYLLIDPENKLSVYYAQHMLNHQAAYVHPRLRNMTYVCLSK